MKLKIDFKTVVKSIKVFVALLIMLFTLNETLYGKGLDKSAMFENSLADALPQTVVAKMVRQHFDEPLPQGKTVKKTIIIGYDGVRADSVPLLKGATVSGINEIAKDGGLYVSYAGGPNKYFDKQATSTAPGWASILTGVWGKENGCKDNGQPKSNDYLTVLTELVENGKAQSSVFKYIWSGHHGAKGATYTPEVEYTQAKGLNVRWEKCIWDDDLQESYLEEVRGDTCADIIFGVYERPDSAGHNSGFTNKNPNYVDAVKGCDVDAYEIIQAIRARDTYDTEDWQIIITSDHGGIRTSHGTQEVDCRATFIATNKPITING
ncbi:MAG: hypothetical protein GX345_02085 [Clostridiales bacterium]|nr:hypothetical protein [Clostridiales bacterium]